MITRLYTLFVGLLLTLFIGVGIAALYQTPKPPEYIQPIGQTKMSPQPAASESEIKVQEDAYNQKRKSYEAANDLYNRNVSLIALAGAILLVALGLTVLKHMPIINDSLLLGGVFTLVYSIFRGFNTDDQGFRFILVSTSLVVAITLGYLKLIKPEAAKKK